MRYRVHRGQAGVFRWREASVMDSGLFHSGNDIAHSFGAHRRLKEIQRSFLVRSRGNWDRRRVDRITQLPEQVVRVPILFVPKSVEYPNLANRPLVYVDA